MRRKILAMALAATLALSLSACGNGSADSTGSSGAQQTANPVAAETSESGEETKKENSSSSGVAAEATDEIAESVTIGISGDPADVGPFAARSEGGIATMRCFFEMMMDNDTATGKVIGVILKEYEVVDPTTYRVTIYDNVHDQAGNPLTASDVKFSFDKQVEIYPGSLQTYVDSEVEDDTHIVFHISPDRCGVGSFESLMMEVNMVTQASYEASPDGMKSNPIGTGPYKVVDYVSGSSMTLERYDDYWQDPELTVEYSKSHVQNIKFLVIPDTSQMAIALETGTIDASVAINDADMVNFVDDNGNAKEGYSVSSRRDNLVNTVIFNARDGYLQDEKVRQAICYCIDAAAVMTSTYGTAGEVGKNMGNENYVDFDPALSKEDYYGYNLDKAKELMAEAGYPDGGFSLELVTVSGSDRENMAQLVQAYCSQIGITVNINVYETALFNSVVQDEKGEWQLQVYSVGANTPYACTLLKGYYNDYLPFGANRSLVVDEELDAVLRKANDVETYSVETTTEGLHALQERAYWYNLGSCFKQIVSNDKIVKAVVDSRGQLLPGACVYAAK